MIIKIGELNGFKLDDLGGKAYHLSKLSNWGFNVPAGYIVTQGWFANEDKNKLLDLLSENKVYAVRSSALDEDGSDFSFAGLQETFLNVKKENIYEMVLKCYQSQWSERAKAYREQHNISTSSGMTVVIQEMVEADFAGVIFTQHPMSNRIDEVVIEVVEGLGENLVSGLKTPSDYIIDKASKEIKSQVLNKCALKEEQIIRLTDIALAIEKKYESYQDIEFAIKDDEIYILQSRPITTTTSVPKQKKSGLRFYLSFGHIQNMTYPITPVGAEMIMALFNIDNKKDLSDRILYNGEHLFVDISEIILVPRFFYGRMRKALASINPHLPVLADEYRKWNKNRKMIPMGLIGQLIKREAKVVKYVLGKKYIPLELDRKLDKIVMTYEAYGQIDALLENQYKILSQIVGIGVEYIGTGMLSYIYLERLFDKWGLDQGDYHKLLAGATGNVTTEMGLLYDDLLRAYGTEEGEELFETYIRKYGMRTDGEIDLGRKRPYEDIPVFREKIQVESKNISGMPLREKHHKLHLEAEAIKERLERNLSRRKWKKLNKWITLMQTFMVLREHPKYAIIRAFKAYRAYIDTPFLTLRERYQSESYDEIDIEERKLRYENTYGKIPPLALLSNGLILKSTAYKSEDSIYGLGVSAGEIQGKIRVIKAINDDYLREGEILVTQFTDPGWTTVMAKAAGFIIEVGGMMTHGAVVAREFGIPAVVSVDQVTTRFKTGDLVRMNGDTGEIELITNL